MFSCWSTFLEKPFVRRVNRRMKKHIRNVIFMLKTRPERKSKFKLIHYRAGEGLR